MKRFEGKDKLGTGRDILARKAMGQVMVKINPSSSEEAEPLSITVDEESLRELLKDE